MLDLKRLYVSPLDADILPLILTGSLQESARNISYHTLQAFPEKRYGFIELPLMEASKLKKKFNGSILRGSKMKVEEARPEKLSRNGENETSGEAITKSKKTRKQSGKEDGVLQGVELSSDRKVKRGWTDPHLDEVGKKERAKKGRDANKNVKKAAASKKPSSHTGNSECLFKTTVPPNAATTKISSMNEDAKSKKRKRGETDRTVIVHEFRNTVKHAKFLREEKTSGERKEALSYVDGKGWVDKNGKTVEQERTKRHTRSKASEGSSIEKGNDSLAEQQVTQPVVKKPAQKLNSRTGKIKPIAEDDTSSSGLSSSESDDATDKQGDTEQTQGQHEAYITDGADNGNSEHAVTTEQVRALSIAPSSPSPPQEPVKQVHPLETLFKRPQNAASQTPRSQTPRKPSLEVKTSFSFFGPDAESNEGDEVAVTASQVVPQTPFTAQDFRERRQRSAAPTPDTAAPGKTFGRMFSRDSDEDSGSEEEGDANSTPLGASKIKKEKEEDEGKESEFAKWFWEHRGETNRAWKRRRREAGKEKRREERKRGKG